MFAKLFRKKFFDRELDEELQAHLDIEARLLMDRGPSEEEARMQARRLFGNRTQIFESAREAWGSQWLDRLSQDLRYAARSLRHSPAFTFAVVLSLALGIGAGTAVFSIADTIFLRPLPYPHPEQLTWVATRFATFGEFLASPDYVSWRRDNTAFQQLAATGISNGRTMLLNGPNPVKVLAASVSFNFLSTLGLQPALGRGFTPAEELPNGPKAVLVSNKLWLHQFGARPDIAGRSVTLDGQTYSIIGVLPASFQFTIDGDFDLLVPLSLSPAASHHDQSMATLAVYGRLKPGVTIAEARADLQRLFKRSQADLPLLFRSDTTLVVQPLQQHRVGNAKPLLAILCAAVSCLFLIACLNVSNLLLARWAARSGELAVRAAIGADRARIARQLCTEAGLLALFGWALSTIFVIAILRGFVRYSVQEVPRLGEAAIDGRVLGIGMAVSLLAILICSVLPVLRAGRLDIQRTLQESGRPATAVRRQLAKRILVVAEMALSLVLLSSAALLLETLWHLRNDRLGFQPEHVLTVTIPRQGTKLENRNGDELATALLAFIRNIPGTQEAARSDCTPLSGGWGSASFSRSDRPLPEAFSRSSRIQVCGAGAAYARAAGIRILRGRFFEEDDFLHPNTVVVINEAAAQAFFPGENPIGKQTMGKLHHDWKTVVGIVSDTKNNGLDAPPQPQLFVNSFTVPDDEVTDLQFIVRSVGDPHALESALTTQARKLDPGLALTFQSLDETIGDMTAGPRFNGILVSSFAIVAVLMAIIGVYGLLTFTVAQRTHEIGIRIALGAERTRILGLVLQEGAVLVFLGIALGLIGALGLTRFLKSILFGVSATDPLTFLAVAAVLIAAGLTAILLPARKAASVDPMIALRHC